MASTPVASKPKTDRKLVGWVFAIFMVGLVVYLLAVKGPDLGQSQVTAKKAAVEKKAEAQRYAAKIPDPARSSSAQFDEARQKVVSQENAAAAAAAAVPPPPMGPADEANAVTPPPPSEMNSNVDALEMRRLERARKAANASPVGAGAPAAPPFVVYEAGPESKGHGSLMQAPLKALDVSHSGDAPASSSSAQFDAEYAKENPNNDPSVQQSQKDIAKYKAEQAARDQQRADGVAVPGEENQQWLFQRQNEKVKGATSIMAQRNTGLYWLAPGTVINAVILNAVDTSLPGHITARVTQTAYDSRYGRYMVIPAGSVLEGEYNSSVKDGQRRVLMAFDTLVTPAGGEVALGNMSAGDVLGRAGIAGTLHTHFFKRMGIATLMAFEAVGMDRLSRQTQVVAGTGVSGPPPVSSGGQIIVDAANEELKQQFSLGPNITIPEGAPMTIITTGGIEIPPIANAR